MVRLGGFEPPTSGATILRSNQLSYNRAPSTSFPASLRANPSVFKSGCCLIDNKRKEKDRGEEPRSFSKGSEGGGSTDPMF